MRFSLRPLPLDLLLGTTETFLWKLRFQWEQGLNDSDRSGAVRDSDWLLNYLYALCTMS